MNTHKFIVLVPHRDSRLLLEDYRRKLFAAGFNGAYAFPTVAPLALVKKPFEKDELKALAKEIRQISLLNDGKISTGELSSLQAEIFNGASFFGPLLDLPSLDKIPWDIIPGFINDKVLFTFPGVVLCAAALNVRDVCVGSWLENVKSLLPDFQPFSFRAAMVTNLIIRPLKTGAEPFSFKWRLEEGCWLPKYERKEK